MNSDGWEEIHAKDLAQHHVGRIIRLGWTDGTSVTGRLAKLTFEHPTRHFRDGSKELGDRISEVTIEVGMQELNMELPLMTEVSMKTT